MSASNRTTFVKMDAKKQNAKETDPKKMTLQFSAALVYACDYETFKTRFASHYVDEEAVLRRWKVMLEKHAENFCDDWDEIEDMPDWAEDELVSKMEDVEGDLEDELNEIDEEFNEIEKVLTN